MLCSWSDSGSRWQTRTTGATLWCSILGWVLVSLWVVG